MIKQVSFREKLEKLGWAWTTNPIADEGNFHKEYAWKRSHLASQKDSHNPEKENQIITIQPYSYKLPSGEKTPVNFELEIRGAPKEESYQIRIYGVNEQELFDNLFYYEKQLIKLWNAI